MGQRYTGAQGFSPRAAGAQGFSPRRSGAQGFSPRCSGAQGFSPRAAGAQGFSPRCSGAQGFSPRATGAQGFSPRAMATGISREATGSGNGATPSIPIASVGIDSASKYFRLLPKRGDDVCFMRLNVTPHLHDGIAADNFKFQ